jgi:hypothetical protein
LTICRKTWKKLKEIKLVLDEIPESVTSKRILGVSNVGRKVTGKWNVKEQ